MTQSAKMWSSIASLEQLVGIVKHMPCCLEAAGLRWPGVKPGLPMDQAALLCLQGLVSHVATQDQLQARASSSRFTPTYLLPDRSLAWVAQVSDPTCIYSYLGCTWKWVDLGSSDSFSYRYPPVWRGSMGTCCFSLWNFWVQGRGRGSLCGDWRAQRLLLFSLYLKYILF